MTHVMEKETRLMFQIRHFLRHCENKSGCNQDFSYFPQMSKYISTRFPNFELYINCIFPDKTFQMQLMLNFINIHNIYFSQWLQS